MMRLFVVSLFILFSLLAFAQPSLTEVTLSEYQEGLQRLVLVKDRDDRIPFLRLDTLVPVFWNHGNPLDTGLEQALAGFLPYLNPPPGHLPGETNLLLAHWDNQQDEEALHSLLEAAAKVPLVLFARQNAPPLPVILARSASVIVLVPERLPGLGVSLLFGGVGTQNRLANTWGIFRAGTGKDVPPGIRLQHAPGAWVNMNTRFLQDSLDRIIEEGIEAGAYPGAQVLVARKGKIVYHKAYGYHTYDREQAVDLDNLYDFASLTKVTGALPALIKLHGEGQFDLDAPLKEYLPEFKGSNKAKLKFREMLAHQARLRPWIPYWQGTVKGNARYPWKKKWSPTTTNNGAFRKNTFQADSSTVFFEKVTDSLWLHESYPDQIYKAIRESPLRKDNQYVYSGLLFYLLPGIVSRITDENYEQYLDRAFYHKLGAYTITYNPLHDFSKYRIVPTERDTFFRLQLLHGTVHDEGAAMMQGVSSNAGLFGTSLDLAKLLQLFLNEGQYGGEYYFSPAAMREFSRYQFPENDNRRGLGFDKPPFDYEWGESYVAPQASSASYGHSGYTGTFAWVDPAKDLIFIFFSNRVYPTRDNRKLYEMNLRPRMHRAVYQAIVEE